jgi:putative endonuclease
MPCFVYIIGSANRTYCGWTSDLDKRLKAHNNGTGAKSTKGRKWALLYAERYQNRGEAMSREWHLKRDRRFRELLRVGGLACGPATGSRNYARSRSSR